jgi:hypothetical protein
MESVKARFLESFNKDTDYNSQIEKVVYDRPLLVEILKDVDNPYEASWKRRVLYESTPRGNIIMYYDIFKQGFAYYSDQTIHYSILNVVAMKYCLLYYCRDFFMDENELPKDATSPFIRWQRDEDNKEISKKKDHQQKIMQDTQNTSFAKFKNYSSAKPNMVIEKGSYTPTSVQFTIKNRFIYLGKIINFSFLQPIKKNRVVKRIPTSFDGMFGSVSTDKVSYKLFKQILQNNAE